MDGLISLQGALTASCRRYPIRAVHPFYRGSCPPSRLPSISWQWELCGAEEGQPRRGARTGVPNGLPDGPAVSSWRRVCWAGLLSQCLTVSRFSGYYTGLQGFSHVACDLAKGHAPCLPAFCDYGILDPSWPAHLLLRRPGGVLLCIVPAGSDLPPEEEEND